MPNPIKPRVPKKGSEIRRSKYYFLQVGADTWFRCRRIDLFTLMMEGSIPMPLMSAVDRIQKARADMDPETALKSITSEDRATMTETIRRVAVTVVDEPKMTHSKRESRDKDLVWVGGISDIPGEAPVDEEGDVSLATLMFVYQAANGEAGLVVLDDNEAEVFRQGEPTLPVATLGAESGVPSSPVVVDLAPGTESDTSGDAPDVQPPPAPSVIQREWKGYH